MHGRVVSLDRIPLMLALLKDDYLTRIDSGTVDGGVSQL